jgi:hypothetical protein
MNYQKLYVDIMNIDSKIRLVTICDINGKVMFSDHRQGVKNLLSPEESKESLELAINSWKTRSKLAPKIGNILYVTTEPEADHSHIINRIRSLESGFQ